MRNRRVSRGLAPTSGQQSEPAPTTGTLSTCRRRCSVGFARWGGLANPTGHFRRRVRAVAFSTEWETPTSIQRRSERKLGFLGLRLCDGFRVCVSAELRAFPASLLSTFVAGEALLHSTAVSGLHRGGSRYEETSLSPTAPSTRRRWSVTGCLYSAALRADGPPDRSAWPRGRSVPRRRFGPRSRTRGVRAPRRGPHPMRAVA